MEVKGRKVKEWQGRVNRVKQGYTIFFSSLGKVLHF